MKLYCENCGIQEGEIGYIKDTPIVSVVVMTPQGTLCQFCRALPIPTFRNFNPLTGELRKRQGQA